MTDLAARIAALPPDRRRLFERLLRERESRSSATDAPLSPGQERLWFLHQLDPGSPAYNESMLFHIDGTLDAALLGEALKQVCARHDVLRSALVDGPDGPVSRVSDVYVELPVEDLPAAHLTDRAQVEAALPFDLSRPPLVRARLFRLGEQRSALSVTAHHAVCDGWSLGVFAGEVLEIYAARKSGAEPVLPQLPVQYAEYARRRRDVLDGADSAEQVERVVERLRGAPPVLELPAERPRPAVHRGLGGRVPLQVGPETTATLRQLARRHDATLFMTTLAAFGWAVGRWTGAEDLVIGTVSANRSDPAVHGLIGFFVNSVAIRTDISGNPPFVETLRRTRSSCTDAFADQDVPFERVVARLGMSRQLAHAPLAQVTFAFENVPMPALQAAGLTVRPVAVHPGTSKVDLSVALREDGNRLTGFFEYDADLFDEPLIRRLAEQFGRVLDVVAGDPTARLSDIELRSVDEAARWEVQACGPQPASSPMSFVDRFAEQVAASPDEVAVVSADGALTYAELDAWSERIADRLCAAGVRQGERVLLALPRSPGLVAAILGVLKSGGAWVPLDLDHPAGRIAAVKADAAARVVVVDRPGRLDPDPCATVVTLEQLGAVDGPQVPPSPGRGRPAPDDLAYVIHTSGTTGRPKGVMVTHAGLANYLDWAVTTYGARPGQESALHTSPAFDLSVTSLLVPLAAGGRIRVLPDDDGAQSLARWMSDAGDIGILKVTPAHVRMLGELLDPTVLRSLRGVLVIGGEALLAEHLHAFRSNEGLRIVNEYGPTETVVGCVAHEVGADDPWLGPVPIGRPISRTRVQVLDRWLRPVPAGITGELYVGGAGVGRGYLHDAARTAERFVAFPDGDRAYRTGDLVRYRVDGTLEYRGRADTQVKLHGFRVELAEVEAVLAGCPQVRSAAVALRRGPAGDYVAGYVVPDGSASQTAAMAREYAQRRLPAYMVPAVVVELAALPLSAADKLDRDALPEPGRPARPEFAPPQGGTEEALASLWTSLLGCSMPGRDDDFFELGGHSVLAAQLVGRVRATLGVELQLRAVFEAPALRALAARVDAARDAAATVPPIEPVPREGWLPLSFAQERFLFLARLAPGSAAYHVPAVLELHGPLDAVALRDSIGDVIARHETLRTVFREAVDGEPMQVVLPSVEPRLPVVDLAALPDPDAEAERRAADEAREPFDLVTGPPVRFSLLRLEQHRHLLLCTLHHIVCDGQSVSVLVREIGQAYAARVSGRQVRWASLPIQYADVAAWERRRFRPGAVDAELDGWKRRLAGAPPRLALPTEETGETGGARLPFEIPPADWLTATAVGARADTTPFMVLLAAVQVVLGRWSGQDDLVLGAPVSGRDRSELAGIVGPLLNTVPLRGDLTGRPSFADLLGRVRKTVLDALEHAHVPFEKIVEAVQPERELDGTPLFQVLVAFESTPVDEFSLPGITVRPRPAATGAAKHALTVSVAANGEGLRGEIEYDRALFSEATVLRFADHLRRVLTAASVRPDLPVHRIDLRGPAEIEQAQRTSGAEPPTVTPWVQEAFSAAARRRPTHPALVGPNGVRSYADVERAANRLARYLMAAGVVPEAPVGILLARGEGFVVAELAVLKAGGCFVPLDAARPGAWTVAAMVEARVSVLVTDSVSAAGVQFPKGTRTVYLDAEADAVAAHPGSDPGARVRPHDPAYVMLTSGSTGRPKAVVVEHTQLASYVAGVVERLDLPGDAAYLVVSTPASDLGHTMVFPALTLGATLHVVAEDVAGDAVQLAGYVREHAVDCLKIVPTHLAALLDAAGPDVLPRRLLVLGGDTVPAALVARVHELAECRVINHYGPTETTVGVLAGEIDSASVRVPLGRPLPGAAVHLLDEGLRPVPIGVAAELYVGGATVARGYVGRAAMTAERFIADPWGGRPGARLYRTGDLGRRRPDGTIEFLGRLDDQVKIRGYRIEPGEIEAALVALPGVSAAAVLARDEPSGPVLVAFAAVAEGASDPVALRAALRTTLPAVMVPEVVVPLRELPLTANGKLDRAALRSLDVPARRPAERADAPETQTEEGLLDIWSELLGRGEMGVHDSFFDVGGHSLLGMQVLSRVRRRWGVELPVRSLFEAPTIASFALLVDRALAEQGGADTLPPLVRVDRGGSFPLSFAQERLWFLDRFEPGSNAYNIPGGVRLRGRIDVDAVEAAIDALVTRHEPLRSVFPSVDGRPVQVIGDPGGVVLERVDLAGVPVEQRDAEARAIIEQRARTPFDLATGPLLRAVLVRLAPDEALLQLTIHHIVADGWSMGVFVREFASLYDGEVSGRGAELPDVPVQYADVASWQRDWLHGEVLERGLAYWRTALRGAPDVLELPTDLARPAVRSTRGARVPFDLTPDDWAGLLEVGARVGATPFMIMLAVWQLALSRWSGQSDLIVGAPMAGRERPELESLMGLFVNTVPLRMNVADDPTFVQLVARVRETSLAAFAYQWVPFDKVVEAVAPRRDPGRTPLVQVMFQLNNAPPAPLDLHEAVLEPLELHSGTSKLDLSLSVAESGGGLHGNLDYGTDLFDASTVERLGRQLQVLTRAVIAAPDSPCSMLSMLDEHERAAAIGRARPRRRRPLLDLIADEARRAPDHVAVRGPSGQLTAGVLDRRANALAALLQEAGVGPETRVGLCMDRAPRTVEAVLAVLKAGGVVVPLDPQFPQLRLRAMIEDAAPVLVLADRRNATRLPPDTTRVLVLPEVATADHPPTVDLDPENAAYVVFTSGTTGRPKGVTVTHTALARHLAARHELYPVRRSDRLLHKASLGFDIGLWELLGPLTAGATVVLAEPEAHHDSARLAALMAAEEVTIAHFGPAMLRVLLDEPELAACDRLRLVFTGGEPLSHDLRERFYRVLPDATLVQQYGPSEATVDVTYFTCPKGQMARALPIGEPAPGVTAVVLDGRLDPVPVGMPGELYLGGETLARGYTGPAGLTAARFVADPFGGPGERLYRTGDRARWLADGTLEFLGRSDQQIKLRGYRIELPEVEVALREHSAVRDAVVVVHDTDTERARLAAFVVVDALSDAAATLRAFLAARLPRFMVPAEFFVVDEVPLGPTGKADRRTLELWRPSEVGIDEEEVDDPPADDLEAAIAGVFADILDLPRVAVTRSFFEQGGNSLIAIRAVERIAAQFGAMVDVPAFFEAPTVRQVASRLRDHPPAQQTEPGRSAGAVRLHVPGGPRAPLFCVHAMLGGVSEYEPLAAMLTDTEAVYGLRAPGLDGALPVDSSLSALAASHVATIRRLQPDGPYRLLGWSFGGVVAYETARQLQAGGHAVEQLVLVDSWAPARMGRGFDTGGMPWMATFAANLIPSLATAAKPMPEPDFWSANPDEQLRLLTDWAHSTGSLPSAIMVADVRHRHVVFEAHARALLGYRPGRLPGTTVTVVRAVHPPGRLYAEFPAEAPTLGWADVVGRGAMIVVRDVPADHWSVLRPPHLSTLADVCVETGNEVGSA